MISIDLNKDPELIKPRKQTFCVNQYPIVTAVKNKQGDLLSIINTSCIYGVCNNYNNYICDRAYENRPCECKKIADF